MAAAQLGDQTRALADAAESLLLRRQIGDRWGEAESLCTQGQLAAAGGRHEAALCSYRDALSIWAALGDRASLAGCLAFMSAELRPTEPLTAAPLEGAADGLRLLCGVSPTCIPSPQLSAEHARARLEGAGMSIPQVLDLATGRA